MPKLNPTYSVGLIRLTYGCGMLGGADDLMLSSISAFSATSRALVSGDVEGAQSSTASNAFHEGAFERLYFKGQTIRLINERLNKKGFNLMDPSLFAGISALIFVEVRVCKNTYPWSRYNMRRDCETWAALCAKTPFNKLPKALLSGYGPVRRIL
jgi:hypothetical protein